jgi:hypothetical protein
MRFDEHPGRNCANGDTEAWFPPRTDTRATRQATALCNGCPVISECLEYALNAEAGIGKSGRDGIYGGMTPTERARLASGQLKPTRHGTARGARAHRRMGESVCGACLKGERDAARRAAA